MPDDLTIRPFSCLEEYEACADFQEEVWGEGFSEKVPSAILMIANRLGGLAAGAFDESGFMHGFVFGITGPVEGELVHWSDMLAVRKSGRDKGLGAYLKWYQREVMLDRGVREMRWTFDPLQGRNAHVNFNKLGIVCREYVKDMYGDTDSPLHRGVGTDRFVAEWSLDSERVEARLSEAGGTAAVDPTEFVSVPQVFPVVEVGDFPQPGSPDLDLEDPRLLVAIPADIEPIMDDDLALAVRWREATREVFSHYLSRGYEVQEFFRGEPVSFYLLERGEAKVGDSVS
ncbi:MAG: GNAT family N-acetyltransferase [Gemmatimonadetes bacterium]|nr:GNAT family N-acetyltransferase [Gemmatimonadota bacterium]